jgi:hypothetical protein
MTIKALYPTVRPTLNLDFAKTKALDPRVTFTRASTATFVGSNGLIQTAASGAARFDHNPTTGESLGLLVEEARTNLRTASVDFSTGWTWSSNVTVASGQTSPTGDSTASLVTAAAGTLRARLGENFVSSGSVVYTRSWFVKKTNQRYIWCGDQNNGNYSPNYRFDLDLGTGTVVSGSGFNSGFSITPFPNGYYRISVSCISGDIWTIVASNSSSLNPLTNTYAHDGTETFVIWGYQLEAGAFPTSYIPTTSATVTRAADVASMTGTNFSSWYNQSQGTAYADYFIQNTVIAYSIRIDDGTGANVISFLENANYMYINTASVSQFTREFTPRLGRRRQILAFASNNVNSVVDGVLGTVDTAVTLPAVNRLAFTGATVGTIARLTYYPVRLPDAQLQALTAT